MKASSTFYLILVFALSLLLAGCGASGSSSTTPPATTTYKLTVTAPAAGAGTITSSPAGINCPSTCTASFASGTMVTLNATPATNYAFGGFGGACSGMTCIVTLSGNANVSDTFASTANQLSITLAGLGTGAVTGNPGSIDCTAGTCSATVPANTSVTLTAAASTGSAFGGWTGGGCTGIGTCTLTLTTATTVTATFNVTVGDLLTVTTAGAGSGTVTSSPQGIICASGATTGCSVLFPPNTAVTLNETPAINNVFASWSGGCTGAAGCSVTLTGPAAVTATFGGSSKANIRHIILFAQENRSLDHYFGAMLPYWASMNLHQSDGVTFDGLPQFNPPVNGVAPLPPSVPGCQLSTDADSCTPDPTNPITSFPFNQLQLADNTVGTVCEENQSPFWNEAHNDWSLSDPADQTGAPAALDGFVYTSAYDARSNGFMDVNGARGMGYFDGTDLNFYYYMASTFGTSDRWFSPLMDRTQLNRAYIYAATSQTYAYPPGGGINDDAAFTATTIFEALQNATPRVTWKIYVDPTNAYYSNPWTGITTDCSTASAGQAQDLCLAGVSYMNEFAYESTIQNDPSNGLWQNFAPISQFKTDIQNDSTFPDYVLIEPASSAGLDEHPSDADGSPVNVQLGAQYVENNVINPFMQSAIWTDSAMIFTYDEAGGLYDHVSPQPAALPDANTPYPTDLVSGDICTNSGQVLGAGTCTFGWTGYRVPLIVISPYSVKNFVSHTVRDTTAVLAMVESNFGIAPLTGRDASYYNNPATSMSEFFDFVNKPWATPPSPAPQNTSGHCDQTPAVNWNEPPELTVSVTGTGSVTSTPSSAINVCTTECTGTFSTSTAVTLTETPGTGSTFTGWGGAGAGLCAGTITPTCMVTVTTASTVTATFTP